VVGVWGFFIRRDIPPSASSDEAKACVPLRYDDALQEAHAFHCLVDFSFAVTREWFNSAVSLHSQDPMPGLVVCCLIDVNIAQPVPSFVLLAGVSSS